MAEYKGSYPHPGDPNNKMPDELRRWLDEYRAHPELRAHLMHGGTRESTAEFHRALGIPADEQSITDARWISDYFADLPEYNASTSPARDDEGPTRSR